MREIKEREKGTGKRNGKKEWEKETGKGMGKRNGNGRTKRRGMETKMEIERKGMKGEYTEMGNNEIGMKVSK